VMEPGKKMGTPKPKNIQTDPEMFWERGRLQNDGKLLCENRDRGGDENCNEVGTLWCRDSDGVRLPMCEKHKCFKCVPMGGEKIIAEMLKEYGSFPIDTEWLLQCIDDWERNFQNAGFGASLNFYVLVKEILRLRKGIEMLTTCAECGDSLELFPVFCEDRHSDVDRIAWREDVKKLIDEKGE
jgi:hypothetical protein